jgi:hypothetical protein
VDADSAEETLTLAMAGYPNDWGPALTTLVKKFSPDEAMRALTQLVQTFVDQELPFQSPQDDDIIIGGLAKTKKDDLVSLLPTLIAHKEVKYRIQVLLAVLSQMYSVEGKLSTDKYDAVKESLSSTLPGLAKLEGEVYGEAQLKASQLLDFLKMPSFQTRLDSLQNQLKSGSANLVELAEDSDVQVDLLTVLMSSAEESIRKAAMEVYIRRAYRAQWTITSLKVDEKDGMLTCSWDFTIRPTQGVAQPKRHGFAAFLPDFASVDASMPKIIQAAAPSLPKSSSDQDKPANVLYVGFGKGPQDEDTAAASVGEVLQKSKAALEDMDLSFVNVFIANPGEKPNYFNFYESKGFNEDSDTRNLRPTSALLLEMNRLQENYDLTRFPTMGRNTQLYLGKEKETGAKRRGGPPQALFLRSISRREETVTKQGAERTVLLAIDELDRARLDPRITATTSSRLFLVVMPDKDHVDMKLEDIGETWQKMM